MGPTLSSLLAASLLLGQTAGAPGTVSPPSGGTVVPAPVVEQPRGASKLSAWRQDRPILSRIQGWFGKKDTPQPYLQPGSQTAEPPQAIQPGTTTPATTPPLKANDFPRKLPSTNNLGQPTEIVPVAPVKPATFLKPSAVSSVAPTVAPTPAAASPILPGLVDKIGRDEKFEWITGQYEIENGRPVIYYATPETVDPHKGRVVLSPQQADLSKLQRGDLISVRGQLATAAGAPVYRLTNADLIERPKR